jgi:signal transduction histidine kinase
MTIASLRKVGALIREQHHVLLARWRRQVRQLPAAKGLDVPSLNDHMPYLIDELAAALESQPDDSVEEALLRGSPPVHGRQRLHDGFNIEEVVAEYNVLRGCVHDLAEEHGIIIQGSDLRVVNRIIDEAIGMAVQTYATQLSLEIKKHRDQHIAFVAHDLRTPLQAISLTVRMIERTLIGDIANPQANKLLQVLRRNIQQLERAVIEVIKTNADSPAAEERKLERRVIDLWPLAEGVIAELQPIISTAGVEVANNIPHDMQAFADAGLLSRAFENLLAYAVNAAPRGAVRIEASEVANDGLLCSVQHNGGGLSSVALGDLFSNGAAQEKSPEDVGLGLGIVKQIIEVHGGIIRAESAEDGGINIEFQLPNEERSI